jgi:hypothetical protein
MTRALPSNIRLGQARDKHSSSSQTFVNYKLKQFYNIGPKKLSIIYKFSHKTRVFVTLGWKSLPRTNTLALLKLLT